MSTLFFSGKSRSRLLLGFSLLVGLVALVFIVDRLSASDPAIEKDVIGSGTLLLRGKGAKDNVPAMRLGTDMDVTVSGQTARVRVTQAFRNTGNQWMEATYLYPLPEEGAVDSLKMVVGQRIIIGKIKPREEARAIYEKARAEGKKAGLVESERPNMFRNSVANIGPGETVLIAIEYQAPVRQLGGEFSLRLPLVVGPRYVPPHTIQSDADAADAAAVTAPLADPALTQTMGKDLNPVSITVHLAPGFSPANVISPYHKVAVEGSGDQRTVRLAEGQVPADRDFELRWRSAGADPTLGLFRQQMDGNAYLMATLTPPAQEPARNYAPREMIFVIDNSGSMGGASMQAAKDSLLYALGTLRPQDRFNIIRFDDTMTRLFDDAVPATAEQIALGKRFTEGLEATGGTEMLPALESALIDTTPTDKSTVRQVIFLTDGDISNEKEMSAAIAAKGGRSRVFMVGIGSAPNQFLMRRMAEAGRGTFTNVGIGSEVNAKMTAMLDRLAAPAVRDLAVTVDGAPLDLTPSNLPDLYAGEPLVLMGKGQALSGKLTVTGMIGDKPWKQTVDLSQAIDSPTVAKLWAGRKIAELEAARAAGDMEDEAANKAITDLGMGYAIVTRLTSLVAVDETPTRPEGATLTREELPLLLPAGWDFDTLLGGEAVALAKAAQASAAAQPGASAGGVQMAEQAAALDLPETATGYQALLGKGFALLMLGLVGLVAGRRARTKGAVA